VSELILFVFKISRKCEQKDVNETYSKVRIGKHLSDTFPIRGIKQGDALSPMLSYFASEYAFWKFHENQVGLKLNGTHQLLAYADDLNLLGYNTDTINKAVETLIDANNEVYLEVNTEKMKYILLSCHQNAGKSRGIKISYRSFQSVVQFRY
jgi:hypothetical protein